MAATFTIGIDPDTNKSGYAIFYEGRLSLSERPLWEVFNGLKECHLLNKITVRLEAGHKVKSTWHKGGNGMAKRVGANHEIGRQIEKFCIEHGIRVELVKPCGLSGIDHAKFCQITGWDVNIKTNPEKRVAALLCYKK